MSPRHEWWEGEYPALARVNPIGAWCGYIGVPPEHPWAAAKSAHGHGGNPDGTYLDDVDVHGGVTFGPCVGDDEIRHTEAPADTLYVGFDCAHYGDAVPGLRVLGGVYRDLDFVRGEIRRLADQARAAAAGGTR